MKRTTALASVFSMAVMAKASYLSFKMKAVELRSFVSRRGLFGSEAVVSAKGDDATILHTALNGGGRLPFSVGADRVLGVLGGIPLHQSFQRGGLDTITQNSGVMLSAREILKSGSSAGVKQKLRSTEPCPK